jgi:hypothetical protein
MITKEFYLSENIYMGLHPLNRLEIRNHPYETIILHGNTETMRKIGNVIVSAFSDVVITNDAVYINDKDGEIVSWTDEEWIKDPNIVPAILHAITLYYTKGPKVLRRFIDK